MIGEDPEPAGVQLSGVVLCGGTSRRLGTDKALLRFAGEPLVLRASRLLATVAVDVRVAGGPHRSLADVLDGTSFAQIEDATSHDGAGTAVGPLGGIVAGLEAARHELVAVLAVDMPFASSSVFRLMAGLIGHRAAAVPVTTEGSEPLHAVYARRAAPLLRAALEDGTRSVRQAVDQLDVRWVADDEWRSVDPSGAFARNVNDRLDAAALGIDVP